MNTERLVREALEDSVKDLPCPEADTEQLLAAAGHFHNRLPELWSGDPDGTPYPAACHPQAWASAAAIPAVQALTSQGNGASRQ